MRYIIAALLLLIATTAYADTYVNGYYRRDGSFVAPHYRSSPNRIPDDNWSSKGQFNPYTGEQGTRNPQSLY
ncbi:MAG: hypothetical protein EOM59_10715 [Clostridia bacterium]|nr:hypothetical protein [Clostridia bacterium]